jgi:HEAT repeat protein
MRPALSCLLLLLFLAVSPAIAQESSPEGEKPDRSVACPPVPAPGGEADALWAALVPGAPDLALEDVLAVSGFAFRATECANDCACREWREEALSIPAAARTLGVEAERIDLSRVPPEVAFKRLHASLQAGRAAFYVGPNETGVVFGTKATPPLFFVRALASGERHDEARPASQLSELWELTLLEPAKQPLVLDRDARELLVLTHALAHAQRPPARGACSFLEEPAVNAWGLAALGLFAERLATNDRGVAGSHNAVRGRVAFLARGREAAFAFLEKAAKRRESAKAGSGASLAAAARAVKLELEEALLPLEKLVASKDEVALADPKLGRDAAALLAQAAKREREALLAFEGETLAARGLKPELAKAVSLAREQPPSEPLAPELAKLAEDGDPDLRLLAVVALADTPGPAAHVALAKALLDRDGPVSEAALAGLEARGEPGLTELLVDAWEKAPRERSRTDTPLQRALLFALADRGAGDKAAVATLARALDDAGEGDEVPDAIPRRAAALLYRLQGTAAEPAFLAALKSPRPGARHAAAAVLDLSGSKQALAALEAALDDPDPSVRLTCAAALGRRGEEKGLKVALVMLRDPSRDVRSAAVDALARCGPSANPFLVRLLEDPDWRVRANACVVLGRTGGEAELAKVAALVKDPSDVVRELAHDARVALDASHRAAASAGDKEPKK